jgi:wyosine [tRNA(Phe)-imidazoG37] synthetase (radical SAM superfamily)
MKIYSTASTVPEFSLSLEEVVKGILWFREEFHGGLCLQLMFIEENKPYAREISPDEEF